MQNHCQLLVLKPCTTFSSKYQRWNQNQCDSHVPVHIFFALHVGYMWLVLCIVFVICDWLIKSFRSFIKLFSRRATGFHGKTFWTELFVRKKIFSWGWSKQMGRIILTVRQFAWCPVPLIKLVSLLWFWYYDIRYKTTLCIVLLKTKPELSCRGHNRLIVMLLNSSTCITQNKNEKQKNKMFLQSYWDDATWL